MTLRTPRLVATLSQLAGGVASTQQRITFPVNPESYQIELGRSIEEVSIIGYRDIPRIGTRKLDKVTFTALFPAHYDPSFCNYNPPIKPTSALTRLTRWATSGGGGAVYPLRLTIAGLYSGPVILTDLSVSTKPAEDPGDIWMDLQLTTWVELKSGVWSYGRPARPTGTNTAKRYVVQVGDSLWSIARKHYGSGAEWRRIWNANKPMRSGNPSIIFPGEIITLPKR